MVSNLDLRDAEDRQIFERARKGRFVVLTKIESPVRDKIERHPNLGRYIERIREKYYP